MTVDASLLTGELVRLGATDPDVSAEPFATWSQDSAFMRFMDSEIARPRTPKGARAEMERFFEAQAESGADFSFHIRTLADDRVIGFVGLDGVRWNHGDAFLGVGLGNREDWGKGYGTDAVRVILRYAFTELNLHRVTLDVFEYNPRAMRSYEKAGFVYEGRMRGALLRDGRRWDIIYMGILREEWEKDRQQST